MPKAKTVPTQVSVTDFIQSIENETRRSDAQTLVKLLTKITGWKPQMWGPTIIGFGAYHYTYESGHSGTSPVVGFSPRKANLVFYVFDFPEKEALLAKLGKHKGGLEQCLYVNKVADVDVSVLQEIVKGGMAAAKKLWPVTKT